MKLRRALTVSLLASAATTMALVSGCGDKLSSCESTLTCTPATGGENAGGQGGDGATGGKSSGGSTSTGGTGTGGAASACDPACSGDKPFCDESGATPTCVGCRDKNDCKDNTDGSVCDADTQTCVQCSQNAECMEVDASVCNEDNKCEGCAGDDDCAHLTDAKACDGSAEKCVECTNSTHCGGNPCNTVTHTCSAYGTNRQTCESCDTDENCSDGDNFCVPMNYNGDDRGGYCLKDKNAGCAKPYSTLISGRATLSGTSGKEFCGIDEALATCEAVRGLINGAECPLGTDAECPESGVCKTVGALPKQCTYECSGATSCLNSGPGSTCAGSPTYCGG